MRSNEPIRTYDSNNNLIHCTYSNGFEKWLERDSNGREIHFKDSDGYERWHEYDYKGNEIHYKDSRGLDEWYWEGEPTKDPVKILLLSSKIHSEVTQ